MSDSAHLLAVPKASRLGRCTVLLKTVPLSLETGVPQTKSPARAKPVEAPSPVEESGLLGLGRRYVFVVSSNDIKVSVTSHVYASILLHPVKCFHSFR